MISTSQAWKDYTRDIGLFHIKAVLDYGENEMTLTDADFMQGTVSITDSVNGMGEFNVGSVIANTFEATLNNYNGKFYDIPFGGATLTVQFGIVYDDDTEEWIDRGIYTLEKPRSLGSTIQIVGYDNIVKLDRYYNGKTNTIANAFDTTTITDGKIMERYDREVSATGKFHSDYIPVPQEGTYQTNFTDYVVTYNVAGRHLGYVDVVNGTVTLRANVAYVICNGNTSNLNSYYFNSAYEDITLPMYATDFVELLCDMCGVEFDTTTESNLDRDDEFLITSYHIYPFDFNENTTCRDVLSWVAQNSAVYFRADPTGKVQCLRFDLHKWERTHSYDGGVFDPWHDTSDDLYDPDARLPQHIFDPETATVINGAGRFVSGFIAVEANEQYFISVPPLGVYFFTSNTVESYAQQLSVDSATRSFIAPSNGYIRFNGAEAGATGYHLYKADGISISGGTTNPWTDTTDYDGGSTGGSDYSIHGIKSLDIDSEDITVTGFRVFSADTVGGDGIFKDVNFDESGSYTYMLEIKDNPTIKFANTGSASFDSTPTDVAVNADLLLSGFTMRPFTAQIFGDPSIEAGDIVALKDYRGVERISIITDLTFVLNSNERLECNAKSPEEMNSQRIRV